MFKAFSNVKVTKDLTNEIQQSLKNLGKTDVYVGIPEGDVGDHGDITNAELMYILTHGVRKKSMRDEMDDMMQIGKNGVPYSTGYNKFLNNLDEGMPYSAAYEMYIHEHGSPLWHIPPRPIIEPAIRKHREIIVKQLKQAALAALDGQDPMPQMTHAGQMGASVVKDWFYDPENKWPPNSPVTIHGSKKSKNGKQFIKGKGSDRPNINTSNLRNSITYVVAKKS